ncbi:DEAD/DEAH box helicase [Chitinophaga solisilvae]|uniref:DEAD/DEAH box helicase n=1 Tax=Chitinophaga solisilvae TaxID=1233460 RepID=UPI001370A691|nr:ATP-binding protein [Chitinophaga solisilvae]
MSRPTPISHYLSILKLWRAAEAFNLPDMPEPRRSDRKVVADLLPGDPFPWELENFAVAEEGKKWKHTLYFGGISKQEVLDSIRILVKEADAVAPEPLYGNTWLSALVLDANGSPYDKSYVRAAFPYAMKSLKQQRPFDEINEELRKAYTDFDIRFQMTPEGGWKQEEEEHAAEEGEALQDIAPVSSQALQQEVNDLKQLTENIFSIGSCIRCVSEQVGISATPEAPFLNSFYANDLHKLISWVGEGNTIPAGVADYLKAHPAIDKRLDLQEHVTMIQCINPTFQSPARWPSSPAFGLYSAQQAAVHLTLDDLRNSGGLRGVNGPPGTGKTTLLREVLADIIFRRAKRLLDGDIKSLFQRRRIPVGKSAYYDIDLRICGNDSILIASNNNNAVENISKELPLLRNIDTDHFPEAAYFPEVAAAVAEDRETWGMLSAVLGNASNCSAFTHKYWYSSGLNRTLDNISISGDSNAVMQKYEDTAAALKSLLTAYEDFKKTAAAYHKGVMQQLHPELFKEKIAPARMEELRKQLTHTWGISPENLPDKGFSMLPMTDIHRLTPYASPVINQLRSNIFLKSLELHACAVQVHAKYFRANLDMFFSMLSGKAGPLLSDAGTNMLWQTFFFCVPVVSTTLASVERLFRRTGAGGLGWLLLDEAGQATPQSAIGAIWRARRSIIIGDTLQIPPVVTMPEGLGKLLQDHFSVSNNDWSPVNYSAQNLADRITRVGTAVRSNGSSIWTGLPLRAHRRCDEPMFTIANEIAYDNQMVKVTRDKYVPVILGPACWIDVKTQRADGHIIPEETDVLRRLADALKLAGDKRSAFIISPFKSVADHCQAVHKKLLCGTIHTFQGKEADIVFIILGSDPARPRAREWVAQSPNMLNVALTRARKYVYIIGNKDLWSRHRYFDVLAARLPLKTAAEMLKKLPGAE